MQIIPAEIQAIPDTSLGSFENSAAYNTAKDLYKDQIVQIQSDFEEQHKRLKDDHEKSIGKIEHEIDEVNAKILMVENEKLSIQGDLGAWRITSMTCRQPPRVLLEIPVCSISPQWFSDLQLILNEKFVLRQNLQENFDCKSKGKWLKSTERSIKKAFSLISEQNEMSTLGNSLEEVITELRSIHANTLLQTERQNSQAMSDARAELQQLNLKHRELLDEVERMKKNNREVLKNYALTIIACPLYKSAVSLIAKHDNGNFMEDVVNALPNFQCSLNPNFMLDFLKSSAFETECCLKVRGLNALFKLLKLNLHHADALQEVKNLILIEKQRDMSTAEKKCLDLIELDADITRWPGAFRSGRRCHHDIHCKNYEQFLMSTESFINTPNIGLSSSLSYEVKWFDISENKNVQYLPVSVFYKFPNLEIYNAFKSGVLKIHRSNFYAANKLQGLWLDHNEISSIESGSFDELHSLKWLYLGFNKLTSIDTQIFHNVRALITLSLENNRFTSLSTQLFTTLQDLEWIYLNDNPVSSQISNAYFTNNKKVTHKYITSAWTIGK